MDAGCGGDSGGLLLWFSCFGGTRVAFPVVRIGHLRAGGGIFTDWAGNDFGGLDGEGVNYSRVNDGLVQTP